MEEMTIKLNAPGMTSLHKAGLAGLYMTLRAFEEKGETIKGLNWELEPTQVKLIWLDDKPKSAFEELVAKSFWLDDGFIRLAGLEINEAPTPDRKHQLNYALQNSFLQFGPENPTGKPRPLFYEVDDRLCGTKDFKPILKIRHEKAPQDFVELDGHFKHQVMTKSWMYPGGITRHSYAKHDKATTIFEPLQSAVALLFAPVGVIYYLIRSRTKGRKARAAMLVPDVKDLAAYILVKQAIASRGVLDLTASSASDAVLRLLITIKAKDASNQFAEIAKDSFLCRVSTFGIVNWNEKQKTRTYTQTVFSGRLEGLENYYLADTIFKNRWQVSKQDKSRKGQQESYFVLNPTAREFIADNIAQGRTWYYDLATFLSNKEARKGLSYERKELNNMVEKASFKNDNERLFISVCHESWRKRMGKLSDQARTGGGYRRERIQKEFERLRTSLLRSRNAHSLRQTIVDLWARAGMNEDLQGEGLHKLLPLFDEQHWRKTRDLALLALISYQPKDPDEAAVLTAEMTEEGEETK